MIRARLSLGFVQSAAPIVSAFFTNVCCFLQGGVSSFFTTIYPAGGCRILESGMHDAVYSRMKSSFTLLLALVIATAFSFAQPVRADQTAPARRAYFDWPHHQDSRQPSQAGVVSVPDGGSTLPMLGCALLGLAALRRKLRC